MTAVTAEAGPDLRATWRTVRFPVVVAVLALVWLCLPGQLRARDTWDS